MKRSTMRLMWGGAVAAGLAWAGWAVAQDHSDDAAADTAQAQKAAEAWQPRPIEPERYRDIVDYNIFRSDRAALVKRVEAERNPPPAVTEVVAPAIEVPADPDAGFVLVGVVLRGPERLAFVEDRGRGQVLRVSVPGDFSAGRLETIDAVGVVYRVDGEDRPIAVGANFLGEGTDIEPVPERAEPVRRPEPRDDADSESDNAERPSRGRPSPEDIERFRRQRQRN